jgi:hypothetical protein
MMAMPGRKLPYKKLLQFFCVRMNFGMIAYCDCHSKMVTQRYVQKHKRKGFSFPG